MNESKKPRLAEVLGVEVEEKFYVKSYKNGLNSVNHLIDEYGDFVKENSASFGDAALLCFAINHPESIIRAPRLTEPELAICKAVGAKWVSRDGNSVNRVELWTARPEQSGNCICAGTEDEFIARFNCTLFPSVNKGDCIEVEVTGGGG